MKWFASLSLALLVLSFTVAQDDKKDNDKFQGKWNMTKGEMNGESLPEDFVKGFSLTFTKDKFEAKMGDGSGEEGTFKLDSSAKPGKAEFTAGGETRKGIFKFDGDDLHLCVSDKGGETPKDFSGKDGNIFFVLKKAK
ncbi:MAG: TIGR03067 domain-containing protein [Gemmatales bacterium]